MASWCLPCIWPRLAGPRATELETTTSTCTTEAVLRRHVFRIQGYRSLLCRTGAGSYVTSDAFEAGGCEWAVSYYPHGAKNGALPGYASAFVQIATPGAVAVASCALAVLPWDSRRRRRSPDMAAVRGAPVVFRQADRERRGVWSTSFVKRTTVEAPAYLRDDCVRIECAVTVFMKPTTYTTRPAAPPVTAQPQPQPERLMSSCIARLLDPEGLGAPPADVFIVVGDETFVAHSFVLWLRCRKLYVRTTASSYIAIPSSEVQPAVLRAVLHYIYTEALPAMADLDAGERREMLRGLLAAAELYEMERLKLECEAALAGLS
ncbi:hypothetical protein ACP4OV_027004 [Aristida adscensionis]